MYAKTDLGAENAERLFGRHDQTLSSDVPQLLDGDLLLSERDSEMFREKREMLFAQVDVGIEGEDRRLDLRSFAGTRRAKELPQTSFQTLEKTPLLLAGRARREDGEIRGGGTGLRMAERESEASTAGTRGIAGKGLNRCWHQASSPRMSMRRKCRRRRRRRRTLTVNKKRNAVVVLPFSLSLSLFLSLPSPFVLTCCCVVRHFSQLIVGCNGARSFSRCALKKHSCSAQRVQRLVAL